MSNTNQELAPAIAALGATITEAMDDQPGFVPCGTPAQVLITAIRAVEGDNEAAQEESLATVLSFIDHVSSHRGVTAHKPEQVEAPTAEQTALAEKVRTLALAHNADELGPDETAWLYRALAALGSDSSKAAKLLAEA